jgi:thiosulfate/3-mercaptopyruvate sulfurtransferase
MHTTIISPAELEVLTEVKFLDCRAKLGNPAWGREAFASGHIPGAQFADLDDDLAAQPGDGGRHPLPDFSDWIEQIREWGIGNDDQVVVYDDAGGAFAARAWWMLRWAGHAAVAVLDGGLNAWSGELATSTAPVTPSNFEPGTPLTRTIQASSIETSAREARGADDGATQTLVDARTEARWRGLEEPIDPIAGHIPGAACLPFQGNLDADGTFKAKTDLITRFAGLDDPIVCYCGSGVTAAHNVLAMRIAGRAEPYLYPGSWSEWIRDPSRPIERC